MVIRSSQRAQPVISGLDGPRRASTGLDGPRRHGTTVRLSEIIEAGGRIEAGAFAIDRRRAVEDVKAGGAVPLYGPGGLAHHAHNAFRFARVYVEPDHGVPFLTSSDIIAFDPGGDRYLSQTKTDRLGELLIQTWDVLISCSGTVGNVALAGEGITGMALSQDAIRVRLAEPEAAGFVAGFLRSRFGRPQLTGASYGSVVTHIEPHHLEGVWVPSFEPDVRRDLGARMRRATEARDQANRLLDEADQVLHEQLGLAPLPPASGVSEGHTVRASALAGRFEASFHNPRATAAEDAVRALAVEVATVGDSRVSEEVRAITRFRKRVYVPEGGVPMLNSKQLFQIDPINRKSIAKGATRPGILDEIRLTEGMICVSCSGTIGRVQIIPRYMAEWTASQDATRILGRDPGYLYAWLASDYGRALVTRHTYGSVIQHIDLDQLASVPVPLPPPEVRREVGERVLQANALRDHAWTLEQDAIAEIEARVEAASGRPGAPVTTPAAA